jgi:cell wall-associated NlpC family hydrolase
MRFFVPLSLAALLLSASFTTAAADAPAMQQPTATDNEQHGWSSSAQEILINALSLTGIKYKYGGSSPETGFDCSGFVRYVFQQAADLTLPHGARALSRLGQSVPADQLRPGDLVFFNTLRSAFSHVGIYLGDNRFIHAPSSGGAIHVVSMDDAYWAKRFNGARRIEGNPDMVAATK